MSVGRTSAVADPPPSTRASASRKSRAPTTYSSGSPQAPLENSSLPNGASSSISASTAAARAPVWARAGPIGVDVREDGGEVGGVPMVRVAVQQHQIGAEARGRTPSSADRRSAAGRVAEAGVQLERQPGATAVHSRCRSSTGSAARAAGLGAAASQRPAALRTAPGPGGSGSKRGRSGTAATDLKARRTRRPCTASASPARKVVGGAGGVGGLLGELFEADDLVRVAAARRGQLGRGGEIAGQAGVDQVSR